MDIHVIVFSESCMTKATVTEIENITAKLINSFEKYIHNSFILLIKSLYLYIYIAFWVKLNADLELL